MASSAVVEAFTAKLAEWNACPLIDENKEGETPASGDPFLFMQFPVVMRQQITFGTPGSNVWRETGAARLVLHIRRGAGLEAARQWADQLVTMFLGKDLNGVITGAPDGPVTDDRNEKGNYYQLAVAVPYEFDFLG